MNFLYNFYDSVLKNQSLQQLLKDQTALTEEQDHHIAINSSTIQNRYKTMIGAGREIGNFLFLDHKKKGDQKIIVPEKFKRILSTIKEANGPVLIYSHYYYNGLLYFKQFLDAEGYQGDYKIFYPKMSQDEHAAIANEFNTGKIKILLLHPDITEGISLKGVRQLHFLEVPITPALKSQIIGRTVRYQSHAHLLPRERNVDVYIWKYRFFTFDKNVNVISRKRWHHRYSEVNPFHGLDVRQVDSSMMLINDSPDDRADCGFDTLDNNMKKFEEYMSLFSIENTFYHHNTLSVSG